LLTFASTMEGITESRSTSRDGDGEVLSPDEALVNGAGGGGLAERPHGGHTVELSITAINTAYPISPFPFSNWVTGERHSARGQKVKGTKTRQNHSGTSGGSGARDSRRRGPTS
jgi:hypothetical protein